MGQKITIIDGGGASYKWWGKQIKRGDRDRPGGHCPSPIKGSLHDYREYHGRKGRKACKKLYQKQARKEHEKLTQEAVMDWYKTCHDKEAEHLDEMWEGFWAEDDDFWDEYRDEYYDHFGYQEDHWYDEHYTDDYYYQNHYPSTYEMIEKIIKSVYGGQITLHQATEAIIDLKVDRSSFY